MLSSFKSPISAQMTHLYHDNSIFPNIKMKEQKPVAAGKNEEQSCDE